MSSMQPVVSRSLVKELPRLGVDRRGVKPGFTGLNGESLPTVEGLSISATRYSSEAIDIKVIEAGGTETRFQLSDTEYGSYFAKLQAAAQNGAIGVELAIGNNNA